MLRCHAVTVKSQEHSPDREFIDEPHARLLEELEARQRNVDWQDTMRKGMSVDALLWRGSPEATSVQRVGIAVFGILFLSLGLFFVFALAPQIHSVLSVMIGILLAALGTRVTLNAFRRKPKHAARTGKSGH